MSGQVLQFPGPAREAVSELAQQEIQQRPHSEGIFLPEAFDARLEYGGGDWAEVKDSRISDDGEQDPYPMRVHNLIVAEIDGQRHVMWHSRAPVPLQDDPPVVTGKLGLAEVVESGIGWESQLQRARRMPHADVLTHGTFGVGKHGHKVGPERLVQLNIASMATHELTLLRRFFAKREIVLDGVSLSSVVNQEAVLLNAEQNDPLNIVGVSHFAPAIVDPTRIFEDMFVRFSPEMVKDGVIEIFGRTHWKHFLGEIAMLLDSRMRARDLGVMGKQVLSLLGGVMEHQVQSAVEAVPTAVVGGRSDPLFQEVMWERIKHRVSAKGEAQPPKLFPVRGGHAIALKPHKGAGKTVQAIQSLGIAVGPAVLDTT